MSDKKESLQKRAWDLLSDINVNDKTETKGKGQNAMTYLSWAWAWGVLMAYYPESSYLIHEDRLLPDGSVIVSVTVTIKDGDEAFSRDMWLPVMDYLNKAIKNPDAMAINKAYMRCLAKAIAMCGLGHYIYAGEDLPNEFDDNQQQAQVQQPQQSPQSVINPKAKAAEIKKALEKAQNVEELNKYIVKARYLLSHYQVELNSVEDFYQVRLTEFEQAEI